MASALVSRPIRLNGNAILGFLSFYPFFSALNKQTLQIFLKKIFLNNLKNIFRKKKIGVKLSMNLSDQVG